MDMYTNLKRRRSPGTERSIVQPQYAAAATTSSTTNDSDDHHLHGLPSALPLSPSQVSMKKIKRKKLGSPKVKIRMGSRRDDDNDGAMVERVPKRQQLAGSSGDGADDDEKPSFEEQQRMAARRNEQDDEVFDNDVDSYKPSGKRRRSVSQEAAFMDVVEEEPAQRQPDDWGEVEAPTEQQPRKKKKRKTKTSSVSTAKKSKAMSGKKKKKKRMRSEEEKQRILIEGIQEAKQEFERHRDSVLEEIPSKYKGSFGEIGFSKWGKTFQPCLVVSPFDVPHMPVRQQWLDMFERVKDQGRRESASWLVYWYGTVDPGAYYSLIPKKNFLTYEAASKKGLHQLPSNIQKKLRDEKKLTKPEQELVRAFKELQEDMEKDRSERKRGVLDFQENYELLSIADVDGLNLDDEQETDLEDSDDELMDSPPKKPKAKKKKARKKSTKKAKVGKLSEDIDGGNFDGDVGDADLEDSDTEVVPSLPTKPKAKKKGSKKTKAAVPAGEIEMGEPVEDDVAPAAGEVSAENGGNDVAAVEEASANFDSSQEVGGIDDIGDEESSQSEDDKKDGDYTDVEAELQDSEDDAVLRNAGPGQGGAKKTKKKSKSQTQKNSETSKEAKPGRKKKTKAKRQKTSDAEEEGEAQSPKKAKAKPAKKPPKPVSVKWQKEKERRAFKKCEEQYCPLLTQWNEALASNDIDSVKATLAQVLKEVDNFAATFIEAYALAQTIKETKTLLKNVEGGAQLVHELRTAFRTSYDEKKKALPPDFKVERSAKDAKKKPTAKAEAKKSDKAEVKKADKRSMTGQGGKDVKPTKKDSEPRNQARTNGQVDTSGGIEKQNDTTIVDKPSGTANVEVSHDAVQPKVEFAVPRRGETPAASPIRPPSAKEAKKSTGQSTTERKQPKMGARSLANLIGRGKRDSGQGLVGGDSSKRAVAPQSAPRTAASRSKQPVWMTEPVNAAETLSHGQRLLALEFLSDMALQFPAEGLNRDAIARSIEAEVFKVATTQQRGGLISSSGESDRWLDPYWKKVHGIVAAVSGKSEPGSLFQDLISGKYATAAELVNLSKHKIADAFEADA